MQLSVSHLKRVDHAAQQRRLLVSVVVRGPVEDAAAQVGGEIGCHGCEGAGCDGVAIPHGARNDLRSHSGLQGPPGAHHGAGKGGRSVCERARWGQGARTVAVEWSAAVSGPPPSRPWWPQTPSAPLVGAPVLPSAAPRGAAGPSAPHGTGEPEASCEQPLPGESSVPQPRRVTAASPPERRRAAR